MARDIIWADLKDRLSKLNWIAKTNESRLEVELINGSSIALRSGESGENLRGGGYDFVVFDETSDIKPEVWYEVIRPALSAQKPPGSALFCGTPKGFNWFKDLYDLGRSGDPDWASFQFTTLEGGNVPDSEIEAARKDLDDRVFQQEYEAKFQTYSGIIAYNFSDENVVKWDPNPAKYLIIGMDFNVDPMTAVVYVKTEKGLHAVDEITIYGSNTDEMVSEIKNRYSDTRIICFPDPAGAQRRSSAGGRTDISILQNAGFDVRYRQRHPAVRDRINATNSLLLNSSGERRLFVDPKCRNLIKAFQRYTYKPGTQVPDKSTGADHWFDSATYPIEYLFPVTKHTTVDNSVKSFGVF